MVDALRRVHRMLRPRGCAIDIHPTARPSVVEVDGVPVGEVQAGDAPERHAAADAALATVVGERLFTIERSERFPFYTYADSMAELREYVEENWRDARIPTDLRAGPGARPRTREQVRITKLILARRPE